MPPKARVSRQMILDTAFQIVRDQGHEQLSARAIAGKLGCSTQPIMYNFKTIEEIREETYRFSDAYHSRYILPKGGRETNPLMELGLNYVRFGHEEKNLFRFLFQTDRFSGFSMEALLSDPGLTEIIQMVSAGMGCQLQEAREAFLCLFASAHGLASLLANNAMPYEEDTIRKILEKTYITFMNRGDRI